MSVDDVTKLLTAMLEDYVIKMATASAKAKPLMLSNYGRNLNGKVKSKYDENVSEISIDSLLIRVKI